MASVTPITAAAPVRPKFLHESTAIEMYRAPRASRAAADLSRMAQAPQPYDIEARLMAQDFQRPAKGFRLDFGGVKVNCLPDAVPIGKHPFALNVRSYRDGSVGPRPGSELYAQNSQPNPITDMRSYITLDPRAQVLQHPAADTVTG
jgi:hypothetical protein